MAYITSINAPTGFSGRLQSLKKAIVSRYKRHRIYRKTYTELSDLSNRELNDLGLSRSNIRSMAYEVAYLR